MAVPPGGYRWWYVDALSDDGRFGVTLIAFIGSVFSPYYAWRGWKDPYDHCALNVALYGRRGRLWSPGWAMTERGRSALVQEEKALAIGRSVMTWDETGLTVAFDEVSAPIPKRLRGRVRLSPTTMTGTTYDLDGAGRHLWRPIAPRADVEVTLDEPGPSWRGQGYFDSNWGEEPIHKGFQAWDWARAHRASDTLIHYDVIRADGEAAGLALRIDGAGAEVVTPAPMHAAPRTGWGVARRVRADGPPRLRTALEDAPFYSRSVFDGDIGGESVEIVHESLDARRLRSPVVQAMLPFRMPRRVR